MIILKHFKKIVLAVVRDYTDSLLNMIDEDVEFFFYLLFGLLYVYISVQSHITDNLVKIFS